MHCATSAPVFVIKPDLGEAGQQRHGSPDARQCEHGRAAPRLAARQLDQRRQCGGGGLALHVRSRSDSQATRFIAEDSELPDELLLLQPRNFSYMLAGGLCGVKKPRMLLLTADQDTGSRERVM